MSSLMRIVRLISQQINDRTSISKSRRSLFLVIFGVTFVFYILSRWMSRRGIYQTIEFNPCVQARLIEFSNDQANMDAIINHHPISYGETLSFPFTGNGYVGLSFSTQSDIQLIGGADSSFTDSYFSPMIRVSSSQWADSTATVLHLRQGYLQRIQCFRINDQYSAHVLHRLYAHRSRPSLIVQDIEIVNPSDQQLKFEFKRKNFRSRSNIKQINEREILIGSQKEIFLMITSRLSMQQHHSLLFVIITKKAIQSDSVESASSIQQTILTVTKYSPTFHDNFFENETLVKQWQTNLEEQAKQELSEAFALPPKKLFQEHVNIWSSIWRSGFSISRSLAPSVINGDVINRTLYYILSTLPAPLYVSTIDETKKKQWNESLFHVDRCYESHSTLLGERLWRVPGDDLAVSQLSNLWRSTLAKKGCSTLMLNGVNGVLQAVLLSIGGIRFRNHHLEMFLDPKELHRDMFFRSIHFGQRYKLNISIMVEQDNRAAISVSIDQENGQAYACDGGCIDPPKKLNMEPVRFPVKMTDPPTAILYVTEDFQYMTELKDTLHVKEVAIAPPHAHDILALHRHGHKLGGLPITFWIALAFLIVVFHLFLLKIVLNEMGFVKQSFPPTNNRARAR